MSSSPMLLVRPNSNPPTFMCTFNSLLFIKSFYKVPLVAQTLFPIYLLLYICFSLKPKSRHYLQFVLYLQHGAFFPPIHIPDILFKLHIVLNLPTCFHLPIIFQSNCLHLSFELNFSLLTFFYLFSTLQPIWSPSGINHIMAFPTSKSCTAPYLQE